MAKDTITQIDEALHALRARVGALEARGGASGGTGSTMRLSDATPAADAGNGSPGTSQNASRGDHSHPAVKWSEIAEKPTGIGQDLAYRHVQTIAADTWVINHNLGKYPTIAAVDSGGEVIVGDPHYTNQFVVVLHFSAAVSGEAYCN